MRISLTTILVSIAVSTVTYAQNITVTKEVKHDLSPPLRDIRPIPTQFGKSTRPLLHPHSSKATNQPDPVVQNFIPRATGPAISTILNFAGVGVGLGGFTPRVSPPDTNGSVGATQYVQWVNESFAVFNKSTGALLYGPAAGNTLWSGFGGTCELTNNGDILAQYDKAANRWVMSQLGFQNLASGPYSECIAVSTTSDATGSYNRYEYQYDGLNDYPKMGIWPDAYYISYDMFAGAASFFGARACAFNRAAMLTGASAIQECFTTNSKYASILPSDLDGLTLPPGGAPNVFIGLDPNLTSLNFWQFHADFANPAAASFTGPVNVPVAAYTLACGNGGICVSQQGSADLLDSLGDRVMYRLAYRNFLDHEALVVNHSVNIDASNHVGVRWYEIRSPRVNPPTVYQQGTFAPDSSNRWMGSIAMDKIGNIAMGYNVAGSSVYPSIRLTNRAPSDPLGIMQAETSIVAGGGGQTDGLRRWGDYSDMSVDPVDDCTLWYTAEYLTYTGSFNWSTRIASFKLPGCSGGGGGNPDFSLSATPSSQTVVQGGSTNYTATVGALNGFTGTISLSVSGLPAGASANFTPPTVTTSGSSTLSVTTASTTPVGTYPLTITGTSGALSHSTTSHSTIVTLVVTGNGGGSDFTITAAPLSRTVIQGGSTSYTATVGALNGFTGTVGLSVSGLPSGASASFTPPTITGSGSSSLSVTTSSTTHTGTYPLTLTGVTGALSHSTTVTLIVTASGGGGSGDFSITAAPLSQTVVQGGSTSYTAAVGALNGFTGTVTLSVSGLPSGASASFNPSTVTTSGSSSLFVTTSSTTPVGTYTLTLIGVSGTLSHSTTVSLTVTGSAPPHRSRADRLIQKPGGSSMSSSLAALAGSSWRTG